MNRYEKALERIKNNVFPQDNWMEEDVEHYNTIIMALESCVQVKEAKTNGKNTVS